MKTEELKPCPDCGHSASVHSTAVSECYGKDWQSVWVQCDNSEGHCGMEISIMADTSKIQDTWYKVIRFWNML